VLTLTYNAARLFDIELPLVCRPQHTFGCLYIYQLISVYRIKDNLTLVFVDFSSDGVDSDPHTVASAFSYSAFDFDPFELNQRVSWPSSGPSVV
jgi:hypothetical protein